MQRPLGGAVGVEPEGGTSKVVTAVVFDSGSGETKAIWFRQEIQRDASGNLEPMQPPATRELYVLASFKWYIEQAKKAYLAGQRCRVSFADDVARLLDVLEERNPQRRTAALAGLNFPGDCKQCEIADTSIAGIPGLVEMGLTAWFRELRERKERFEEAYGADYRYDDPSTATWQYHYVLSELEQLERKRRGFLWHVLSQDEEGRFEVNAIRYAFEATNILSVPAAAVHEGEHRLPKWRPKGAEKLPDAIMACGTGSFQFTLPDVKDEPFLMKCGVGHGETEIKQSHTPEQLETAFANWELNLKVQVRSFKRKALREGRVKGVVYCMSSCYYASTELEPTKKVLGGSYESLAGFFRYFETDRSMPVEWTPSAKRPQPAKTAIKMALRYKVLNAYAKRLEERKAEAIELVQSTEWQTGSLSKTRWEGKAAKGLAKAISNLMLQSQLIRKLVQPGSMLVFGRDWQVPASSRVAVAPVPVPVSTANGGRGLTRAPTLSRLPSGGKGKGVPFRTTWTAGWFLHHMKAQASHIAGVQEVLDWMQETFTCGLGTLSDGVTGLETSELTGYLDLIRSKQLTQNMMDLLCDDVAALTRELEPATAAEEEREREREWEDECEGEGGYRSGDVSMSMSVAGDRGALATPATPAVETPSSPPSAAGAAAQGQGHWPSRRGRRGMKRERRMRSARALRRREDEGRRRRHALNCVRIAAEWKDFNHRGGLIEYDELPEVEMRVKVEVLSEVAVENATFRAFFVVKLDWVDHEVVKACEAKRVQNLGEYHRMMPRGDACWGRFLRPTIDIKNAIECTMVGGQEEPMPGNKMIGHVTMVQHFDCQMRISGMDLKDFPFDIHPLPITVQLRPCDQFASAELKQRERARTNNPHCHIHLRVNDGYCELDELQRGFSGGETNEYLQEHLMTLWQHRRSKDPHVDGDESEEDDDAVEAAAAAAESMGRRMVRLDEDEDGRERERERERERRGSGILARAAEAKRRLSKSAAVAAASLMPSPNKSKQRQRDGLKSSFNMLSLKNLDHNHTDFPRAPRRFLSGKLVGSSPEHGQRPKKGQGQEQERPTAKGWYGELLKAGRRMSQSLAEREHDLRFELTKASTRRSLQQRSMRSMNSVKTEVKASCGRDTKKDLTVFLEHEHEHATLAERNNTEAGAGARRQGAVARVLRFFCAGQWEKCRRRGGGRSAYKADTEGAGDGSHTERGGKRGEDGHASTGSSDEGSELNWLQHWLDEWSQLDAHRRDAAKAAVKRTKMNLHTKTLRPSDHSTSKEIDTQQVEWDVGYHLVRHLSEKNASRSTVEVSVIVVRKPENCVDNIAKIMCIITFLNFTVWAFSPHELDNRMATNLALIIAGVALKFTAASRIPNVPYNTTIDTYLLFSFYLMMLIVVENSFIASILNGVLETPNFYFGPGWSLHRNLRREGANLEAGGSESVCDVDSSSGGEMEVFVDAMFRYIAVLTFACMPLATLLKTGYSQWPVLASLAMLLIVIAVGSTDNRITAAFDDNELETDCQFYRFWAHIDWACAICFYCFWVCLQLHFFKYKFQHVFLTNRSEARNEKIKREPASATVQQLQSRWRTLSKENMVALAQEGTSADTSISPQLRFKTLALRARAQRRGSGDGDAGKQGEGAKSDEGSAKVAPEA